MDSQIASGLTNQIIIYSKNWYGESDNAIEDIKALMQKYSGCAVGDGDAWQALAQAAAFATPFICPITLRDTFLELAGKKWVGFNISQVPPEQAILASFHLLEAKYFDFLQKYEHWRVPNDKYYADFCEVIESFDLNPKNVFPLVDGAYGEPNLGKDLKFRENNKYITSPSNMSTLKICGNDISTFIKRVKVYLLASDCQYCGNVATILAKDFLHEIPLCENCLEHSGKKQLLFT
jgi:hypothetical protein